MSPDITSMLATIRHLPEVIRWQDDSLFLLDQTQLPLTTNLEEQRSVEDVWQAIYQLKVRGAPAIGVAAAYGLCVAIRDHQDLSLPDFYTLLEEKAAYLDSARPTAVNLGWALRRMMAVAEQNKSKCVTSRQVYQILVTEAQAIHHEDIALCDGMGEQGKPLIQDGMGVLTHCNAGALATAGIGTATAPMYKAHADGVKFRVYADETRPLLQGARLTSWELQQSGLDVTLITDNMSAHLMSQGLIDMVIVGTDRVAANGDVANKIGTMAVAILAKYFNIPFYVACPSSTIDMATATGAEIPIEEREKDEVIHFGARQTGPSDVKVRNPAFDVTPNELVAGIITETEILRPPFAQSLAAFSSQK